MSTDQPTVHVVVLNATQFDTVARAYAQGVACSGAPSAPHPSPPPPILTATDVAARLRVRRAVVIEALRSGALQGQRGGRGRWRVTTAEALRWFNERFQATAEDDREPAPGDAS